MSRHPRVAQAMGRWLLLPIFANAEMGGLRGSSEGSIASDGSMLNQNYVLRKRFDLSKAPSEEFDIASYPDQNLTHSCANYTDDGKTVFSRDGNLVLRVDSACEGGDCLNSGRIMSKESFKYGLFIFTAKVPKCNYIWPALWLLPEDKDGWGEYGRWPCSGEIDVLETVHDTPDGTFNLVSGYGTAVDGCSEAKAAAPSCNECVPSYCTSTTMNWRTGVDRYFVGVPNCSVEHPSWDEHTFVLSWQPGEIATYIDPELAWDADGRLTSIVPKYVNLTESRGVPSWKAYQRRLTSEWLAPSVYMETCFEDNATANAPFDKGFKLVLNIAIGGYGGAPCSWGQSSCSDEALCGANIGAEMVVSNISVWDRLGDPSGLDINV